MDRVAMALWHMARDMDLAVEATVTMKMAAEEAVEKEVGVEKAVSAAKAVEAALLVVLEDRNHRDINTLDLDRFLLTMTLKTATGRDVCGIEVAVPVDAMRTPWKSDAAG